MRARRAEEAAAGLDEIVGEGARRMLIATMEAEVAGYIEALAGELDEHGHRLVVRYGHAERAPITTAAGRHRNPSAPGGRPPDRSRVRRTLPVPLRHRAAVVSQVPEGGRGATPDDLHGMSTGGVTPALAEFFGSGAGLSASVITRLTKQWQEEQAAFARRDLSGIDYVYVWSTASFNVRLQEESLCALVMVGVRADGTKELVAIEDGYRESTERWADVLRPQAPGMRAPVLAVDDGALGFWGAREVFPASGAQRCWVRRVAKVLSALPASAQSTARRTLSEIRDAGDRDKAVIAIKAVAEAYAAKYPKPVAKIVDDTETRLAFFDFPAEHWIHLKTPTRSSRPSPLCGFRRR